MKRNPKYKHLSATKNKLLYRLINDFNDLEQNGGFNGFKLIEKVMQKNTCRDYDLVNSFKFDQSDDMVEKFGFSEYKIVDKIYDKDYFYAVESEEQWSTLVFNIFNETIQFVLDCDDNQLKDFSDSEYTFNDCEDFKNFYFNVRQALEF